MGSNAVMAGAAKHPFWMLALKEIFSRTWCGDDPVSCTGPRLIDRLSWEHVYRNSGCGAYGCIARLPYQYFSPHIAHWNVGNMVKECVGPAVQADRLWFPREPVRSKLSTRACQKLEQVIHYPSALRTASTFAVHHWQCSWCRKDETMLRTVPLMEIIWLVGNETVGSSNAGARLASEGRARRRRQKHDVQKKGKEDILVWSRNVLSWLLHLPALCYWEELSLLLVRDFPT